MGSTLLRRVNSLRKADFKLVKSLDLKIISYGGAPKEYFEEQSKQFESYFDGDKYFRTYDIRPGL